MVRIKNKNTYDVFVNVTLVKKERLIWLRFIPVEKGANASETRTLSIMVRDLPSVNLTLLLTFEK